MELSIYDAIKEYKLKIKHGKVQIKKYLGNDKKVVIPDFIDGMPVTKIETWAFAINEEITEVTIPDTVRYIGYGAFGICKNLKKVTFSGKVYLNGAVFVSSGLEEVIGLEYITGDDSGRCFFDGTPFLEKNDILILDNMLIKCKTEDEVYVVPENVTSIGYMAFWGSSLKKVILPNGLKHIHNWAFEHTNISGVKIPDSVEVLEYNALETRNKSDSLEDWEIPQNFGRRPGWDCYEFFSTRSVIHDTQFRVENYKERSKCTDERIYEDVSCISCGYNRFLTPLAKQTFPKRLEYLKHVGLVARARVSVFKNDDFKIERSEEIFSPGNGYLHPTHNTPRKFRIIFDLDDAYGEILFYLPYLPWAKGNKPTNIYDFYNKCLNNGKDGKFFDMDLYDSEILNQDIPLKVKGEIAKLRCSSNYRLSDKARENYKEFLRIHHKRLQIVLDDSGI